MDSVAEGEGGKIWENGIKIKKKSKTKKSMVFLYTVQAIKNWKPK